MNRSKLLKMQSIACDSLTFLFSLLCGSSVHRKLNDCRLRPKLVNSFFFFFFFFFFLIFHTTIFEALVFERVIKLIGEQKLAEQRLQKKCFTSLV